MWGNKYKYIFRISEWWHSKIAMFSGWAYFFALLGNTPFQTFLMSFFGLLIWYFSAASFGYFINDIYDLELDEKAGKGTQVGAMKIGTKYLITLALSGLQIGSFAFLLWHNNSPSWLNFLSIFTIILFLLYSHPLTRLKQKAGLDILSDSLYAQILPITITYLAILGYNFNHPKPLLVGLFIWAFLSGIKNIVEHQLIDFDYDATAKIENFAQNLGFKKTILILKKYLNPLEYFSFGLLILIIYLYIPLFSVFFLAIGLFVFLMSPLGENILSQINKIRTTEVVINSRILYESGIFVMSVLVFFSQAKYVYLTLLPIHILMFRNEILKQSFFLFYRVAYNFVMFLYHKVLIDWIWYKTVLTIIVPFVKLIWYGIINRFWILFKIFVNHIIYYFRKYILLYDESKARGNKE